jgi:hypothetical protein
MAEDMAPILRPDQPPETREFKLTHYPFKRALYFLKY